MRRLICGLAVSLGFGGAFVFDQSVSAFGGEPAPHGSLAAPAAMNAAP